MARLAAMLVLCGVLIGGQLKAADDDPVVGAKRATVNDDPVGTKLATAKGEYAKDLEKARGGLVAELKKKAEAVQKTGDLKGLEKVEDEIKALEEKGTLPKAVATTGYDSDVRRARAKLEDAYAEAVKGYTKDGQRAQAKAVQQDLDDFKKGDAAAKDPPADDGFQVGTKLVGTSFATWVDNKKRMTSGSDMEFEVTKRSGKDFTAECWFNKRKSGCEVEGTIDKGQVKCKLTKALTDDFGTNGIDNNTFAGNLEKGVLTGTITRPKSDPTYRGDVKLKPKKD